MRNGVSGSFERLLYRLLFVILCSLVLSGSRCASTRGAGQGRAETIAAKTETVKQIIEGSTLSPEQKQIAFEVLDSIAVDTKELGRDVDHNKEIADKNEAAARQMMWLKILAGFVTVGAIGFGVKKFLL